jgi:hypothetical protein
MTNLSCRIIIYLKAETSLNYLSGNGPLRDTWCSHAGHQIESDGRTPEDSNRSLLPVL